MASIMDQVTSLGELFGRVPAFVYEQDRLLLMGIAALSAAVGVGTVTRNHELGLLGKISVALLLAGLTLALCLVATYGIPFLAEMGRQSRGGVQ